jgi:nicotinate-nucleotide pyrophosphorylase (carboxylating)
MFLFLASGWFGRESAAVNDIDHLAALVKMALAEDVASGDLTAEYFVPESDRAIGRIIAKESGVFAGGAATSEVFRQMENGIRVVEVVPDGTFLQAGDIALTASGPARALLTAERTVLNFLQRLSGVATLTQTYINALEGAPVRVLDTRKTTPGWRFLEKAAVRSGGGHNHRMGLDDHVMVKDNHLLREPVGEGLAKSIAHFKGEHPDVKVELEADTLDQVSRFLEMDGVDSILLDNMTLDELREAVQRRGEKDIELEASGGVTLETIGEIAKTGVDCISVGALTHSAPALDLSMTFAKGEKVTGG